MSSLARLLSPRHVVSGYNLKHRTAVETLEALGIACATGHSSEHLERFDPQLVIYSSAVAEGCEELGVARHKGIRTARRGEALSWLFNEAQKIGITGTHYSDRKSVV